MKQIRFAHLFKKMPRDTRETFIKDVGVIDFKDLTLAQIAEDTEIVGGGFYQLPKSRLIWVKLWTTTPAGTAEGKEWMTYRRFTEKNIEYYTSLIGESVEIVILKPDDRRS